MRFILNFFLFGFLFYLISVFFPEAFSTLVSWAAGIYGFFHGLVAQIMDKISEKKADTATQTVGAFLPLLFIWFKRS